MPAARSFGSPSRQSLKRVSTPTATAARRSAKIRALWIARINAAARSNGLSYSRMISGLKKAGVEIDRKVLADILNHDDVAFSALAEKAKSGLAA